MGIGVYLKVKRGGGGNCSQWELKGINCSNSDKCKTP